MEATPADPRRDLETIRALMERARHYRHPPVSAGLAASALGFAGAYMTRETLAQGTLEDGLSRLGCVWGVVFVLALSFCIGLTYRSATKEGMSFWSPLAVDVIHALWPPLATAFALTWALVGAGKPGIVPSVWLLCYGTGAIAAGAYARGAVRGLGLAFLAAGVGSVLYPSLEPWLVLGSTFGGFHLVYALALLVLPRSS